MAENILQLRRPPWPALARLVTSDLPTVVWTTDVDRCVQTLAGGALSAAGLAPEELLGRSIETFFAAPPWAKPVHATDCAFAGERVTFSVRWGDLEFRAWVEPVIGENEAITGTLGVAVAKAEAPAIQAAALERHDDEFAVAAGVGEWTWDLAGERFELTAAWARELGCPARANDIHARAFEHLIHPDDRAALLASLERHLRGASSIYEAEFRLLDRAGRWRRILDRGRVVARDDGRAVRMRGIAIDLTERDTAREAAHASRADDARARGTTALGRAAASVGRAFRTLLANTAHDAATALDRAERWESNRAELARLAQDLQRASDLTERLEGLCAASEKGSEPAERSALAGPTAGVEHTAPPSLGAFEPVDLNELVDDFLAEHPEGTSGVTVEFLAAPDVEPVRGMRAELEAILAALFANAMAATHERGRIVVATENVRLDDELGVTFGLEPAGCCVVLTVSDDGRGMAREVEARMFEPFFTTRATQDDGAALGLGLPLVFALVERHGGDVRVTTDEGLGTTVQVILPSCPEAADSIPVMGEDEIDHEGGPETVLVVERDSFGRRLVARALERSGYRVFEATSRIEVEALVRAKADEIDLVLLEPGLVGTDGRQRVDALRAALPGRPILFAGSYARAALPVELFDASPEHVLVQPWDAIALLSLVREALDEAGR